MKIPIHCVDAFSSSPFGGNPAAVCLIDDSMNLTDDVMLKIAAEMNLSETAFVRPLSSDDSHTTGHTFSLRWFTPTIEVPLCGHATLASAGVLFFVLGNQSELITFKTLSGDLKVTRNNDYIAMDLPRASSEPVSQDQFASSVKIVVGDLPVHSCHLSAKTKKLLVRLDDSVSREQLEAISPDITALHKSHDGTEFKGVIVTTSGEGKPGRFDFLSRYFAPWNGINEDPVTGSAHTVLAGYWASQLNKTEFLARQCSKRGGDLRIVLTDTAVNISGPVSIVLSGSLNL